MGIRKIATFLLLGSCFAVGIAAAQEPPPYPGNDAAPGGDQAAQGNDAVPADDPAAASIDYFHQQLSPYGQWVTREGYGEVWVPQVAPGWRPYTTGHWAYTDQGWAWVADESWGWAPFHYGRWYYDQEVGWAWAPGTVWAPAWVAWRHGGGYLGWAPLPPAVGFTVGLGLDFGGVVITPGFYTFVGERDILAVRVSAVILPSARNVTIVSNTTNVTNYTVVNNRIVNSGVSVERIEKVTGHPVPRLQVAAMASAGAGGRVGAFYQPPVVKKAAMVSHAEFGKALPTQVAAQKRSHASGHFTPGTAGGSTAATKATVRAGATGGYRGGSSVGSTTGSRAGPTASSTAGSGAGSTAGSTAGSKAAGAAGGHAGYSPTSGTPSQPRGSGSTAQPLPQDRSTPAAAAQQKSQQAPPQKKAPPPPPKEKEKEKEHKPPPPR